MQFGKKMKNLQKINKDMEMCDLNDREFKNTVVKKTEQDSKTHR